MPGNNNLLLLIIAGVIALIVLHITTSNQTCSDIPVKKVRKAKKVEKVDKPPASKPTTTESSGVVSSSVATIKNQAQTNTVFNGKIRTNATLTYGWPHLLQNSAC
jgi:hypothetical protein